MRRLLRTRPSRPTSSGMLVSMVDVLTVLLVFLLKSYSTDPAIRADDPEFHLPTSANESPADTARSVEVTQSAIFMDGSRRTGTRWYLEHDEDLVREIYELLLLRPDEPLQVRADGAVPYRMIRKILFTAQQAGIQNITLVAESRSSL